MIRAIRLVTSESYLLLRRDRIFVPALIGALLVAALANIASDWSADDFSKILFDIGLFGFQMTGCLVALFWGVKSVSDSRQEGSIEIELAAPVSRTAWMIGKYLGLAFCLLLLGGILLIIWQGFMLLNSFGWLTESQFVVFVYMIIGWLVIGAMAQLFACFLSQGIAIFSCLSVWLVGLVSSLVAQTIGKEAPELTKQIVGFLSRVWDLQQFNLISHALDRQRLPWPELANRAAYGVLLILSLMTVACVVFQRRDVGR